MRRAPILVVLAALIPASWAQAAVAAPINSAAAATSMTLSGARSAAITPQPPFSQLELFGHTAFVSPQGVGGIFVGCFEQGGCQGSMVISRNSATLGMRGRFSVAADNGGIVHFTLSSRGRQLLRQQHQLRVEVAIAQSEPAYYYYLNNTVSAVVTLVPFS